MVQSDRDICCSASPGTGRGKGGGNWGAGHSFHRGAEGADILGYRCQHFAGRRVSAAFFESRISCELLKVLLLDQGSREGHVWFSFRLVLNVIRYEGVSWLVL